MRTEPVKDAAERDMLGQYLDYQRATMLAKAAGLSQEQLGRPHPPSSLTLAGLLYHLALVEETWMVYRFAGRPTPEPWAGIDFDADPEWEFRTAATLEPDAVRERYEEACARSRDIAAAAGDLDQLSVVHRDGQHFTLRWVLLHLLEETARHAGHADLIRERVDGRVGQ